MQTIKRLWIFVGLCLWGFPTGILMSYMLANLIFADGIKQGEFQPEKFKMYLMFILPLFCLAGWWLGVYMGKLSEESMKKSNRS
ncbi:MAG: hypothetical protein KBD53_03985 [Candidatus Omnitrophica bacterium]|nr:hypothetical protein [Candidatus Omnitrophota bacterium]